MYVHGASSCLYFPLQSNTTDDVMKASLASPEMSQFFGQKAEVRAAKETHSGLLWKDCDNEIISSKA